MVYVTEGSVKSAFYLQIPGVCRASENFLIFFLQQIAILAAILAAILILFLNFCYELSVFN